MTYLPNNGTGQVGNASVWSFTLLYVSWNERRAGLTGKHDGKQWMVMTANYREGFEVLSCFYKRVRCQPPWAPHEAFVLRSV